MADTFRIIDPKNVLFGIEGAGQQHVLALLSARISQLSGLGTQRVLRGLRGAVALRGRIVSVNGVALTNAWLPEFGSVVWAAARLVNPVTFDPFRGPVDLVFAVVGPAGGQLEGRRIARCFERLSRDRGGDLRAACRDIGQLVSR